MGKGSGGAPQAPDPREVAREQAALNRAAVYDSAKVNQINQINPFGQTKWTGKIGSPDRTQTVTLTPELQSLLDSTIGNQRHIADNTRPLLDNAIKRTSSFSYEGLPNLYSSKWEPETRLRLVERFNFGLRDGLTDLKTPQRDPVNLRNNLPELPTPDSYGDQVQQASDAVFNRGYNRLRPIFEQQADALNRDLTQRGLPISGEASLKTRSNLGQQHSDALENLVLASDAAGRQEHQRLSQLTQAIRGQLFNENLSDEQFKEAQRQAGFSELLTKEQFKEAQRRAWFGEEFQRAGFHEGQQARLEDEMLNRNRFNMALEDQRFRHSLASRQQLGQERQTAATLPLHSYATLSGLAPPPGLPQFTPYQQYNIQSPDLMGLTGNLYNSQIQAHAARQAAKGSGLGALGSLGGSILQSSGGLGGVMGLLSDERAKENIVKIGEFEGHNLYEFNYKGDKTKHKGVIAQEIEETKPDAITEINGLKYVNYDAVVLGEAA